MIYAVCAGLCSGEACRMTFNDTSANVESREGTECGAVPIHEAECAEAVS